MERNFLQIITEQRDEIPVIKASGWVAREQEGAVNINSRLVQIISGIRRSGKSTLAHRVLTGTNYGYVNFDDERLTGLDAGSLNLLLEALYAVYGKFTHLLLDEIQNVDSWHLFVNRLLRNNIKIILTGSNSKLLNRESASQLTGRYSTIELFPFSFCEFLNSKGVKIIKSITARDKGILFNHFNEYMKAGGFPEVLAGEDKKIYLLNLFEAIVTRDIIYRHNIRNVRTLKELAILLSGTFAGEISYNRLKNIFALGSENTVKNYITYFEEAWLFLSLPKFSFKKQESLRYRKIYLIDPGFTVISGKDFSLNFGRLLENIVFLQLIRDARRLDYEVYYYKKNCEVDFVIYHNRKVIELIQVTITLEDSKTLKREVRSLVTASHDLNATKLTIITMREEQELTADGLKIEVKPVTGWMLEKCKKAE
ncbi:MAG: ATP-binding protein [Bacteroidia bacterium]|nr:ATP-binding protein [Bacteroidia bacterium]